MKNKFSIYWFLKSSDRFDGVDNFFGSTGIVNTKENIDYRLLDVLFYSYDQQVNCTTSFSVLGGLRFLKYNSELRQILEDEYEIMKLNSDSKGFGLVFRLESVKNICDCFDLKGKVGASALCVSRDSKMVMEEDEHWDFGKGNKAVGSVEAGLQLARTLSWGCRDFDLHLGVKATHWIGLGEYRYYADDEDNFSEYGDVTAFRDQLMLWGFNAGVSFRF